jgi:hypothetical protein
MRAVLPSFSLLRRFNPKHFAGKMVLGFPSRRQFLKTLLSLFQANSLISSLFSFGSQIKGQVFTGKNSKIFQGAAR